MSDRSSEVADFRAFFATFLIETQEYYDLHNVYSEYLTQFHLKLERLREKLFTNNDYFSRLKQAEGTVAPIASTVPDAVVTAKDDQDELVMPNVPESRSMNDSDDYYDTNIGDLSLENLGLLDGQQSGVSNEIAATASSKLSTDSMPSSNSNKRPNTSINTSHRESKKLKSVENVSAAKGDDDEEEVIVIESTPAATTRKKQQQQQQQQQKKTTIKTPFRNKPAVLDARLMSKLESVKKSVKSLRVRRAAALVASAITKKQIANQRTTNNKSKQSTTNAANKSKLINKTTEKKAKKSNVDEPMNVSIVEERKNKANKSPMLKQVDVKLRPITQQMLNAAKLKNNSYSARIMSKLLQKDHYTTLKRDQQEEEEDGDITIIDVKENETPRDDRTRRLKKSQVKEYAALEESKFITPRIRNAFVSLTNIKPVSTATSTTAVALNESSESDSFTNYLATPLQPGKLKDENNYDVTELNISTVDSDEEYDEAIKNGYSRSNRPIPKWALDVDEKVKAQASENGVKLDLIVRAAQQPVNLTEMF